MALLLSIILTTIEDLAHRRLKLESACVKLESYVEKAINLIRFGKKLDKILLKIANGIQAQLAFIGTHLQSELFFTFRHKI